MLGLNYHKEDVVGDGPWMTDFTRMNIHNVMANGYTHVRLHPLGIYSKGKEFAAMERQDLGYWLNLSL